MSGRIQYEVWLMVLSLVTGAWLMPVSYTHLEKFGREFPEIIDDVKLERKLPLIIEIPDRHGTGRKPDFITSYVNEAIGLKL